MSEPGYPGTPRWVKLSGALVLALALVGALVLLIGGGHGPWQHGASNGAPGPSGETRP